MEWFRGEEVGRGSFATISLAIPRGVGAQALPLMAVKSSAVSQSASLKNEKEVLDQLGSCPEIVRCFGDSHSAENGESFYNLLLEFASRGSLADQLKDRAGRLPEREVLRYTGTILRGLRYIHEKGYVHCDIKLRNILVSENGDAKIADFGLAKKMGENREEAEQKCRWRGTPLYLSPEAVNDNKYEAPCDIWALGCAVVEMLTGKPAWNCGPNENVYGLLMRIGVGEESPDIPGDLSEEGKDFLGKCLERNPIKRWTADMLLNHPFVADRTVPLTQRSGGELSTSPRCPFDFPEWSTPDSFVNIQNPFVASSEVSPDSGRWFEREQSSRFSSSSSRLFCPRDAIGRLATLEAPDWSNSDGWITVR